MAGQEEVSQNMILSTPRARLRPAESSAEHPRRGAVANESEQQIESIPYIPFNNMTEAWFWFIQAQQIRNDGANCATNIGVNRPCEPIDFLNIMNRLYRNRMLDMNHFKVLRHYGMRQMAPDPKRPKERRSWKLWKEAFNRMEPIMQRRGIIRSDLDTHENWSDQALIYESQQEDLFAYE